MRAAALENGDAIKPLIGEIRSRMEELVARELALREREHDLERQFRLLQTQTRPAGPKEWLESQERLRERSAELDAQALDLATRTARIKEWEDRLQDRQAALEQTQREVSQQAERARRRHETFLKLRTGDHETLRQRVTRIREREQDLENRIRLAHADIVQQREKLEQQRNELQARAQAFEDAEDGLRTRKSVLERELAELEHRAASLSTQQQEVERQHAEVVRSRDELTQIGRALEQKHRELEERARRMEAQVANSAAQQGDVKREQEGMRAQRAALLKQQAEHEQRLRRLSDYEEQLRARSAALESETRLLAENESEIEGRRRELQSIEAESQRVLREAEQQREEILALREQAEARDAEVRQRQLAAELEMQELASQRAALERALTELDDRRMREEGQLSLARKALSEQAAAVRASEGSWLVRPGRWWLRAGALALVGGTLLGSIWFAVERPKYEAGADLRLAPGAEQRWAFAHEQRLRSPELMAGLLGESELSGEWRKLRQAGQVRVQAVPESSAVHLATQGTQPAVLEHIVAAAVEQYARQSSAGIESAEAAQAIAQLEAERVTLESQTRETQRKQTARQNMLATLASEEQRDQVRTVSDQLRSEYEARGKALADAQSRLTDIENAPVPRGNVLPADYENALVADEMYQADLKEFRTAIVEYRGELAVTLLLLSEPLKNLQATIAGVAGVVAEQRTLQPPPSVAAVLEQFESELGGFTKRVTEFATGWNEVANGVRSVAPEQPLADVIGRQVSTAEKARQFCGEAKALEDGLRGRLEQFTSGSEGGTREVVVVAVLRSELAKLNAGNVELGKAADNTDASKNVRLDAMERQLRGLQSRLERRQGSVRQLLQFEADERARRDQVEQSSALRQSVQELEQTRERLIRDFGAGLDELRRLEDEVVQRRIVNAEAERAAADLDSWQMRTTQIDQQIAAARQGGVLPPVEASAVAIRTVAGEHRGRHAALAGLAAAASIYAVSFLSLLRNPLQRRRQWESALRTDAGR